MILASASFLFQIPCLLSKIFNFSLSCVAKKLIKPSLVTHVSDLTRHSQNWLVPNNVNNYDTCINFESLLIANKLQTKDLINLLIVICVKLIQSINV